MFKKKDLCLTEEEYNTIKEWAETHDCSCKHENKTSCYGGEISVIFTPTPVGTAISARCICGKEIDLNNL